MNQTPETEMTKAVWTIDLDGLCLCKNGKPSMSLGRVTPMSAKDAIALANQIAAALNAQEAK